MTAPVQLSGTDRLIAIHGCYHNRNFGDLLILDLVSEAIEQFSGRPALCPWINESELQNVRPLAGKGLRSVPSAALAVLGGGGYLTDDESKGSTKRLLRYLVPALIWRGCGIPYAIIGVGAGPQLSRLGASMVRSICGGAAVLAVRDQESKDILIRSGVNSSRIEVTADWALSLTRDQLPELAKARARALVSAQPNSINLGLHLSMQEGSTQKIKRIISETGKALAGRDDVKVLFIFDHLETNKKIIAEAADECLRNYIIIDKQPHWVTAAIIAELDAVITTKLHVGIVAFALDVPAFSIASHEKTQRFYRQINRLNFSDTIERAEVVMAKWVNQIASRDVSAMHIDHRRSTELRELSGRNKYLLGEFISRNGPGLVNMS